MTGWNLPPGCNVSDLPGNGPEPPCEVCGKELEDCICPSCPQCHSVGEPKCYEQHGMVRTQEQIDSFKEAQKETTDYYDSDL